MKNSLTGTVMFWRCLFVALGLLPMLALLDYRADWSFFYRAYFCLAYVLMLLYFFLSTASERISGLHKCFALTLIAPPLAHLIVELALGLPPQYIYRLADTVDGGMIETIAYAIPLLFLLIFSIFTQPVDAESLAVRMTYPSQKVVLIVLLLQSILFAMLSILGQKASFFEGGYADWGTGPFGQINAWGAMSTVSLILAWAYRNPASFLEKRVLILISMLIVFGSSLFFGKRADVIGLGLIAVSIIFERVSFKRVALASVLGVLLLATAVLFGSARQEGIASVDVKEISFVHASGTGFSLPSVTDFFSTMPYVISYISADQGDLWYGRSYLNALSLLMPAVINPFRIEETATTFLQEQYFYFNGGMYFVAELCFNFGMLCALLLAIPLALLINRVGRRLWFEGGALAFMSALAIIDGFPRWLLYGTSSFTKHLLLILLFSLEAIVVRQLVMKLKR